MKSSAYVLRPAPPVRAFLTASTLTVLGAVLVVLAAANRWHPVVTVLGGVLIAAGLALTALGIWALFRLRVHARFDATGYTITSQRGEVDGPWIEVRKVTLSGPRLVIERREGADHEVLTPLGDTDPVAERMLRDMTRRLHNRYGL